MNLSSLLSLIFFIPVSKSLSCLRETGDEISMWVALKEPQGSDYVYYDPETDFQYAKYSLNDTKDGSLAMTMTQLWNTNTQYIIYNDENPEDPSYNFTKGHTKSIWAFDNTTETGFVIQHSIPNFPLSPSQSPSYKGLPSSAWTYGQSVFCISVTVSQLEKIASLTPLMIPNIYDYRLDIQNYPTLAQVALGKISADPVCDNVIVDTETPSNLIFFAKSTQWNNELWSKCVSPFFESDLLVESWIHGEAEGPSCGSLTILDVQTLDYPIIGTFSEYNDHSKWAISSSGSLVCFGDINRMSSQYQRGGSVYCFQDSKLWESLQNSITKTNQC